MSGRDEMFSCFVDAQGRDATVTAENKLPDLVGVEHFPIRKLQMNDWGGCWMGSNYCCQPCKRSTVEIYVPTVVPDNKDGLYETLEW